MFAFAAFFLAASFSSAQIKKADLPPRDEIWLRGVFQESDGDIKHLRGSASVRTSELEISADEIDFNSATDWAYAHGHVHLEHFVTGDKLDADHGEYNLRTDEGKFYVVHGTAPAKVLTSPGVLTTTNPFSFQAQSADRFRDRYVLHHGFLTDCKLPKPWWVMQSPKFDVVPGQRAIARSAVFRIHSVPVLYLPWFYRPLGRNPRESGFLTPNFGHSTQYGWIYGLGYYWAINRSYDMTVTAEDFSQRGPAFNYLLRGKPTNDTDFSFRAYGVDDKMNQGGQEYEVTAHTKVFGFSGQLDYNYLSSFIFRQAFSYTFATAIYNEVDSAGFLQRRFDNDNYTLSFAFTRNQTYLGTNGPSDDVVVQKLPVAEVTARDQRLGFLWFSLDASAGEMQRIEPAQTISSDGGSRSETGINTGAVARADAEPHVFAVLRGLGFSLEPGITAGATEYSSSYSTNETCYLTNSGCAAYTTGAAPVTVQDLGGSSLFRRDLDATIDLRFPTLEKVYTPPKSWHLGTKLKHVIEAEAQYEYVTGIDQFQRILRFDATDLLANTNQLTLTVRNRVFRKDTSGTVSEILDWDVTQARFFDPSFGGSVVPGQDNLNLAEEILTPYPFLDQPRQYSPVISNLVLNPYPFLSLEWHAEYDPLTHKMVVDGYNASYRRKKIFTTVGETAVNIDPLLFPHSNQISYGGGYGSFTGKGLSFGASELYDLALHRGVFQFFQVNYNKDCCGFGFQYRRINFGIRDENQYLFSLSIANIGTFGSLQRQERVY